MKFNEECNHPACITNDPEAFIYCRKCMVINFPLLDVEQVYEMFVRCSKGLDRLFDEDPEFFDVLSPNEFREDIFELYNKMILTKIRDDDDY
jgi:hypothetical protein